MRDRTSRFSAKVLGAYTAARLPETLTVHAATADSPAEILLYDEIGPWGVTAQDFVSALAEAGPGPVRVRINSPGGSVFDGLAMYNALIAHPGGVETQVDGLAASAASLVACAGTCTMADASMLMIHRAWTVAMGNTADLAASSALLAKIDEQLVGIYASKSGKPAADYAAMMDAETWLTAKEACDAGLADVAAPPPKKNAKASAPVEVAAAVVPVVDEVATPAADAATDEQRARMAARLRIALAE